MQRYGVFSKSKVFLSLKKVKIYSDMANLQKIKVLAKEKGISINDLAEQLGITPQAVHLLVRENSTKTETLERIAHILEVPVSVFFDEKVENISQSQSGNGILQNRGQIYNGINQEEHDELIRLREENKYLKQMLADKDKEIIENRRLINHFIGQA